MNANTNTVRLGSEYDESLFLFTAHFMFNAAIRMTFFLAGISDEGWVSDTLVPAVKKAYSDREEIVKASERILDSRT